MCQKKFNCLIRLKKDLNRYGELFTEKQEMILKVASETGLSTRTIDRYLKMKCAPNWNSALKIYRFLLKENFINCIPEEIESNLKNIKANESINNQLGYSLDIKKELVYNSIFRKIYLRSIGRNIHQEEISFLYGEEGELCLKMMLKNKILVSVKNNEYKLTKSNIELNARTFQAVARDLIQDNFHPNNINTYSFFYQFHQFNTEGLKKLRNIEKSFKEQRDLLLQNPTLKGDIPTWSISTFSSFSG